jgi:hypothetical protein
MEADVRSYITDVTSTDTALVVKLGPQGHEDMIQIRWGRSIADFPAWEDEVELHWSGTSRQSIEFAQEFAWALDEAARIAKAMVVVACGDGRFTVPYAEAAPDYVLAMLVMRSGEDVFYKRGREVTGRESVRLVDLDGLRALAREIAVRIFTNESFDMAQGKEV